MANAFQRISSISVDLPDPDTPVTVNPEREGDIYPLQVVLCRAPDRDRLSVALPSDERDRYLTPPGDVVPGDRVGLAGDVGEVPSATM